MYAIESAVCQFLHHITKTPYIHLFGILCKPLTLVNISDQYHLQEFELPEVAEGAVLYVGDLVVTEVERQQMVEAGEGPSGDGCQLIIGQVPTQNKNTTL